MDQTYTGGDSAPSDVVQEYNPGRSVGRVVDEPEKSYEDPPSIKSKSKLLKLSARQDVHASIVSGLSDSGTIDHEVAHAHKHDKKKKNNLKRLPTMKHGGGSSGAPPGMAAAQVQQMVAKIRMEIEQSLFAQINQVRS